jgi:hypothetical protein
VDRPVAAEGMRERGEFRGWGEEVKEAVQNGTMTIVSFSNWRSKENGKREKQTLRSNSALP